MNSSTAGSQRARPRPDRAAACLRACGVAAGPVFVVTFSAAGRARAGYDRCRQPVSALALGPGGAIQRANFIAAGVLYLAGSIGLGRAHSSRLLPQPGPIMVAAAAIGLVGSGVFATDPVGGYPPGTPAQPGPPTRTGTVHTLCGIPIFAGIPAAALLSAGAAARAGNASWAGYSATSAAVMAATMRLAGHAFAHEPSLVAVGGLLQRIAITSGFGWLTAVHVAAGRETNATGRQRADR